MTRAFARACALARKVVRDEGGLAFVEFAYILPFVLLLGFGGLETANYVITYMKVSQIAMTVADNAARARISIDETDVDQLMVGARKMGASINFAQNGRIILSQLEMRTSLGSGQPSTIKSYVAGNTANGYPPDNPNGYRQWVRWQRCTGALSRASSYGAPINASGAAVTNLASTAVDDGAVETASTLLGMGPGGPLPDKPPMMSSANTMVMFVEVYYTYTPLVPVGLLSQLNLVNNLTIHTTEAFNVRQRSDQHLYNASSLSGTNLADCTQTSATTYPVG